MVLSQAYAMCPFRLPRQRKSVCPETGIPQALLEGLHEARQHRDRPKRCKGGATVDSKCGSVLVSTRKSVSFRGALLRAWLKPSPLDLWRGLNFRVKNIPGTIIVVWGRLRLNSSARPQRRSIMLDVFVANANTNPNPDPDPRRRSPSAKGGA